MIIREAEKDDIDEISDLIKKLQIKKGEFEEKPDEERHGLIDYIKTIEQLYRSRNPFFLVAQGERNGESILGVCLAYEDKFFRENLNDFESEKITCGRPLPRAGGD